MDKITIDEFNKIEIRVGKVEEAINVEKSEKLIRLIVNFNEFGKRTIFTGVRGYGYKPEDFVGNKYLFILNLEYRKMPSYIETPTGKVCEESQGMILAVDGLEFSFGKHGAVKPLFVRVNDLPIGSKVR